MKMKVWHFITLVLAIVAALAIVHYYMGHKGQGPVSAYLPGGK